MGRSKASEPVHEPLGAKVRRRADRQNIRRPALKQAVCSDSDPIQRIANDSQVLLAAIRNDEALTFAREQLEAQGRFERFHLLAHSCLADTQFLCCTREVLAPSRYLKGPECVQR